MRSLIPGVVLGAVMLAAMPSLAQDKVGIAVCDEFLEKYTVCARDKMPAAQRGTILESIDHMRSSWKQILASSPESKGQMDGTCRQTMETMKTSLSAAYGCSF